MSCILHIETSTDVCSVAVSLDGARMFGEEDHSGKKQQKDNFPHQRFPFLRQRKRSVMVSASVPPNQPMLYVPESMAADTVPVP